MCPPVRPRIMGCGGAVGKRWHLLAGRPDVLGRRAVIRYRPPRRPLSCAVHVRATRRHRVARPSLADPALERRTLLAGDASGEAHATAPAKCWHLREGWIPRSCYQQFGIMALQWSASDSYEGVSRRTKRHIRLPGWGRRISQMWWAQRDLNSQPRDYESPALTVAP